MCVHACVYVCVCVWCVAVTVWHGVLHSVQNWMTQYGSTLCQPQKAERTGDGITGSESSTQFTVTISHQSSLNRQPDYAIDESDWTAARSAVDGFQSSNLKSIGYWGIHPPIVLSTHSLKAECAQPFAIHLPNCRVTEGTKQPTHQYKVQTHVNDTREKDAVWEGVSLETPTTRAPTHTEYFNNIQIILVSDSMSANDRVLHGNTKLRA